MPFLCRLLLVCVFALFAVRGAAACEHAARPAVVPCTVVGAASEIGKAAAAQGHHLHSTCQGGCCAAGCGVYCGALLVETQLDARVDGASGPSDFLDSPHDGITHAPPLPPPIV